MFGSMPCFSYAAGVNSEGESTDVSPDLFRERRHLKKEAVNNSYVYSKMSAMDPDPLLSSDNKADREKLKEKYGSWKFWDGDEYSRPNVDYCHKYQHRDIPGTELPDGAWQKDAVFVNHFLNEAEKIVPRTFEAIFTEYGWGKPIPPEMFKKRAEMFRMEKIDLTTLSSPPEDFVPPTGKRLKGGWTTKQSYDGLVRRVLHAIMTNDHFTVVLGGDAAAAGHANHFRQSYLMYFHRILSPILARLGVKLVTRNMAMGHGLATFQSSLGFSSLYGQDIDVLIWDGAMTEADAKYVDLFFRQGLLSSGQQGKIPFLLVGGNSNFAGLFELLQWFHVEAGAHVGQLGTAFYGVPLTESAAQAANLTYAFQFLRCSEDAQRLCHQNKYCTHCWLERADIANPKEFFPYMDKDSLRGLDNSTASQPWWYPGWRQHQLLGRNLAYAILDAVKAATEIFLSSTLSGLPLDDGKWHVGAMYSNMRSKLQAALAKETRKCYDLAKENLLPSRICRLPLYGVTQHTPRPNGTSITEIIVGDKSLVPTNPKSVLYQGEDVHNKCLDPGSVDVVQVANLRRRKLTGSSVNGSLDTHEDVELGLMPPSFQRVHRARWVVSQMEEEQKILDRRHRRIESLRFLGNDESDKITLGKGWAVHKEKPGKCDGEYLSVCGRDTSDPCPLLGYHDSNGEIVGVEACGWLTLSIPTMKEGILVIKYAFYDSSSTGNGNGRNLVRRRLVTSQIPDAENFAFEFAIDGQVTSWKKPELLEHTKVVHRKMEAVTLLDKVDFSSEPKTVELAIRVKGCQGSCIFAISHVYWA